MYCSKCGRELREGDTFCSTCGTRIVGFDQIIEEVRASEKVSRDHIAFDWGVGDLKKEDTKKKEVVFDWGATSFGVKNTPDKNGGMFKDKEMVERATSELELGSIRNRALGLHDEVSEVLEKEEKKEQVPLAGIESVLEEFKSTPSISIKDLEAEIFGGYEEPEVEEVKEVDNEPKACEIAKEEPEVEEIKVEENIVDEPKVEKKTFSSFFNSLSAAILGNKEDYEDDEDENASNEIPSSSVPIKSVSEILKEEQEKQALEASKIEEVALEEPSKNVTFKSPLDVLREEQEKKDNEVKEVSITDAISSAIIADAVKDEIEKMVDSEIEVIEPLTVNEEAIIKEEVSKSLEETISSMELAGEIEEALKKEETIEENDEESSLEHILEKSVSEYTNEERKEIDDFLEKTIVYKRSSIEKALQNEAKEEPKETKEVLEKEPEVIVTPVVTEPVFIEKESEEKVESEPEIKEAVITGINVDTNNDGKLDTKFNTFYAKNEAFDALIEKERTKVENQESDTLTLELNRILKEADIENVVKAKEEEPTELEKKLLNIEEEPKKKGLFSKKKKEDTAPTSATMALEELAKIMEEQRAKGNVNVVEDKKVETEKVEVKEETKVEETPIEEKKEKVSRMTLTGINLDGTYDFSLKRELDKVPNEIINEEIDKSALDNPIDALYEDKDEPKKKRYIGAKIIIFLLILVILCEASIVIAKYVAPESPFAEIINTILEKITSLIS